MPNHCENVLFVSCKEKDKDELLRFREFAKGECPWKEKDEEPIKEEFCCNKFVPVPKKVIRQGFDKAGYDWCVANWGTKWGAYDIQVFVSPFILKYMFSTAWGPFSEDFMIKMSKKFPALEFVLMYREPGVGFSGSMFVKTGEMIDSHFRDWVNS